MPPTPLEENSIVQVIINGRLAEQQCLNVLHYLIPDGFADYTAPMDELINTLDGADHLLKKICAATSQDFVIVSVDAQPVWPTRLTPFRNAVLTNGQGELIQDALPSNVSAVLTKRTAFAGRDQRGAFHLSGLPVDNCSDDEWVDAALTRLGAIRDKIPLTVNVGGFGDPARPVLWSPGSPTVTADVTSCIVQRAVRVMRRRGKGYGR